VLIQRDFPRLNGPYNRHWLQALGYGRTGLSCQIVPDHPSTLTYERRLDFMLKWSLIFLVVAVVAGIFGFFNIVAAAAAIAKVLFFIFLVLFIITLFTGRNRSSM
jgi:uncharacterized membrane protein YtjA (UPF0391 family)